MRSSRATRGLTLALSTSLLTLPPGLAWAGDPLVEIVVSDDIEDATLIRDGLRAEVDRQLEIQQVPTETTPDDPKQIRVEVTGVDFEYQITTDVERHGKYLRDARTVPCNCSKTDLLKTALREVVASLAELEAASDEAASDVGTDDPGEGPDPRPTERVPKMTAMGGAGIGVAVLGAAGVATGIAFVLRGEEYDRDDGIRRLGRDFRTPGYAALGAGAALLVAGVTLVVLDQVRLRRKQERMAIVPQIDGRRFGLGIAARF
jgi:hypothetical protein